MDLELSRIVVEDDDRLAVLAAANVREIGFDSPGNDPPCFCKLSRHREKNALLRIHPASSTTNVDTAPSFLVFPPLRAGTSLGAMPSASEIVP